MFGVFTLESGGREVANFFTFYLGREALPAIPAGAAMLLVALRRHRHAR